MTGWALITDHWRLKSLSVALALVLFGAVAFAQNPVTVRTMTVPINSFLNESSDLVLVSYPKTVDIQLVGLASAVNPVKPDDIRTVMDLSGVRAPAQGAAPQRIKVNVNVQVSAQGVSLQESQVQLFVTIDRATTTQLPLQVLTIPAAGVTIDKTVVVDHATQSPVSQVTVSGPANLLKGLSAFVNVGQVQGGLFSQALPVQFRNAAGRRVSWPPAFIPEPTIDVGTVDVTITAHQNLQQKTVPVLTPLTGTPACGYEPGLITVSPSQTVTVTGTVTDLARISSITLNAIDVSGASSNVTSKQPLTLPSDLPSLQVSPASVTVNVSMKQVYTCTAPSPQPSPSVTPSTAPTP